MKEKEHRPGRGRNLFTMYARVRVAGHTITRSFSRSNDFIGAKLSKGNGHGSRRQGTVKIILSLDDSVSARILVASAYRNASGSRVNVSSSAARTYP